MHWKEDLVEYIRHEAQPVEKFSHQPRLAALTQQIAAGTHADEEVLFAAVWLHDLGVFTTHRPADMEELKRWDNTQYAMQQAPAILTRLGFPPHKIDHVVACIAQHQAQATPATLEATILRDADILEQLGAIGALRTICKVGRDTRFHTFADAVTSLQKALDTLPGKILLPQTQLLAAPRIAILQAFLQAALSESGNQL